MGLAKKMKRRTRLDSAAAEKAILLQQRQTLLRDLIKFGKVLVEFAKGENWVAPTSGLPSWVGEGNPQEQADATLKEVLGPDYRSAAETWKKQEGL